MTEEHDMLHRIDKTVARIEQHVLDINGRVKRNEQDIANLREKITDTRLEVAKLGGAGVLGGAVVWAVQRFFGQ